MFKGPFLLFGCVECCPCSPGYWCCTWFNRLQDFSIHLLYRTWDCSTRQYQASSFFVATHSSTAVQLARSQCQHVEGHLCTYAMPTYLPSSVSCLANNRRCRVALRCQLLRRGHDSKRYFLRTTWAPRRCRQPHTDVQFVRIHTW